MRVRFPLSALLLMSLVLTISGCAGAISSSFAPADNASKASRTLPGTNVAVTPTSSPNTAAGQGVAINGNQAAYVSSTNWMAGYTPTWSQQWKNTRVFTGLPSSVDHLGDLDYYNGKLIVPAEYYYNCSRFGPAVLAVYDAANGALTTWSDISADLHEASAVTVIPEKNQLVVSSFCDAYQGFTMLWVYDLTTVLNNVPGTPLRATQTIQLSAPVQNIQGISWNSAIGQFLASTTSGGPAGSLSFIAGDGTVTGPVYVVPGTQSIEMEGADFSTGSIYYLENGYVHNLGAPAPAPVFDLPSGAYNGDRKLTITDAAPGAVIHYTTNGSMPTETSPVYTDAIKIHNNVTVNAIAYVSGAVSSPMTVGKFTKK